MKKALGRGTVPLSIEERDVATVARWARGQGATTRLIIAMPLRKWWQEIVEMVQGPGADGSPSGSPPTTLRRRWLVADILGRVLKVADEIVWHKVCISFRWLGWG